MPRTGSTADRAPSGARRPTGRTTALGAALLGLLGASDAREVAVGAAASLAEPMEALASAYEAARPGARVRLVLGASNVLAQQLRAGAPFSLLVSADPAQVERLAAESLVERGSRRRLAGNRLVVLAREELDAPLASARDLAGPAIRRIAVPDAAVPVGGYARAWLAARGLLEELEPRLVATEHARATLAAVDAGHVDAAIAYATDARQARHARVAFAIPDAEQPPIVYEAALRAGADAEARGLLVWLAGPEAARILREAGFSPPPGAP